MDYDKLIEQLNDWNEKYISNLCGDRTIKCEEYCINDDCLIVKASTALSTLRAENEKLRAELEQVTRDFDGICKYIDSEGFLRKQFCENGNSDLEPCICPSLKEHPGYIDSDDCEGCDYFCNSWRGQKED